MSVSAQTQKEIPAHPRTSSFQEDARLTGTFYYVQRERSRKDMADDGKYKTGHSHTTLNASLDIIYTVQAGQTKGMQFKLHFIQFNNHSDIPSHGYRNIFQNERDIKFTIIAPFTFL